MLLMTLWMEVIRGPEGIAGIDCVDGFSGEKQF
jgi:hypothetical protein